MFADKVQIEVKAGKGGDGKLSFRHEKFQPRGGPDGGDGGKGGDVIIRVDHNLNTLSHFKTNRSIRAEDGLTGGTNRSKGRSGEDVIIKVPVGTQVIIDENIVADLTQDGQEYVVAQGGRGGFGNAHFKSSTRQAPRIAEVGEPGEQYDLTLELKLVADIGLVGLPNAGKSTFLSVVSNAKPEIGDYPFTTIIPNLGVMHFEDATMLVADIPGLIEGASAGKGLGDEFLRHIERTSVLFHLIDAGSEDIKGDYETIQRELKNYQVDLTQKPQLIVLTKIESVEEGIWKENKKALEKYASTKIFAISSIAHRGLDNLLREAKQLVLTAREERRKEDEAAREVVIDAVSLPDYWRVELDEDGQWRVQGERIEGFARRTNWDNDDGLERMRDIMRKMGIAKELKKQGIEPGDVIRIGEHELEWL